MDNENLTSALIECNFLFNCIGQMELQANELRRIVKNNIGSGKYQLLKKLDHDKKILKEIYDENRLFILQQYEKIREVEFELLKNA